MSTTLFKATHPVHSAPGECVLIARADILDGQAPEILLDLASPLSLPTYDFERASRAGFLFVALHPDDFAHPAEPVRRR